MFSRVSFMSNCRKYSPEFKADAIELVNSSGHPVVQVATEIGVNEGTLRTWVRGWKEENAETPAVVPGRVEWARFRALWAENVEPKREVEFLGKVSAFFASKQRKVTTPRLPGRRRPIIRSTGCG